MCFGSSSNNSNSKSRTDDDDLPARPAAQQQSESKSQQQSRYNPSADNMNYGSGQRQSHGAGAGSGYTAPPGPPPGHHHQTQQSTTEYAPPLGPPPGQYASQSEYTAPPGPPPGHAQQAQDQYAPPPGPPPPTGQDYAAPPGPPPGRDWASQPPLDGSQQMQSQSKHDWESVVPDTSLFPPPPAIFSGYEKSPSSNATEEEAEAGERWCQQYPLTQPMDLDADAHRALTSSNIRLMEPAGFSGKLAWLNPNWSISTVKNSPDRCTISYPPLYSAKLHDPTRYGQARTIYYEAKLQRDSKTVFVAMGFTALPYPSFRMPGWHRGSLAIHGDDGHKYINDRWGGKEFTQEFRRGETYGLGMKFEPSTPSHPHPKGAQHPHVTIFFTRNGHKAGEWSLHEETDAEEDLPVTGLEGFHDVCCAIGTYDAVNVEVIFEPSRWLYRDFQ